ncbi:unnamed protein product [Musa acuminata subsp. burmannicoides]
MEHEGCKMNTPTNLGSGVTLPVISNKKDSDSESLEDMKIDQKQGLGSSLATPTPEKPEWSSKARVISSLSRKQLAEDLRNEEPVEQNGLSHGQKKEHKSDELPENYQILAELFSRLETSTRLLGLRKLLPTFRNICTQVEVLTKRKILYSHIAQMKYIFPEAIQTEKILVHDKESLLVIPDMKITLLKEVANHNSHSCQSASVALCKTFRARLLDFFITHPEGTDIPEAELPEPFNQRSHSLPLELLPENSCIEPLEISAELGFLSNSSLLPSSFKRQFSKKGVISETHTTQVLAASVSFKSTSSCDAAKEGSSPPKFDSLSSGSAKNSSADMTSNSDSPTIFQYFESTPVKGALQLGEMTDTPAQQTPKRPVPTPHEKLTTESEESVDEARLTTSARRSLIYSTNMEETVKGSVINTSQKCMVAEYFSHEAPSTRSYIWEEETGKSRTHLVDMGHNLTAANSKDYKLVQMGDRKRNEMLAGLSETFDAICFISRSINCSIITKEELLHKILSNNLEIEETREAEEHLSLLERLLPDWISKKDASNGQHFYRIEQTSDREALRAKLLEAL